MKLKEFGPGGGASKILLCRSATVQSTKVGWLLLLEIDRIPDEVEKKKFLFLHLARYLFNVAHGNRYTHKGSKENALSTIIAENVSLVDR